MSLYLGPVRTVRPVYYRYRYAKKYHNHFPALSTLDEIEMPAYNWRSSCSLAVASVCVIGMLCKRQGLKAKA